MTEREQDLSIRGKSPRLGPTERQRAILRLIVQDYIGGGRPVGSKSLVDRYPIGVSSATIRNEMAELEELGYIEHLHTSGGRVPTVDGYRFYVRHLMGQVELPSVEQIMISHQFRQAAVQLDAWMELAATVLAESAGNISVVTAPRTAVPKVRHLELISLQPRLALVILVTVESLVRQAMIHLPEPVSQESLSQLADVMARDLRGLTANELERRLPGTAGIGQAVLEQATAMLRDLDAVDRTEMHHSGVEHIVAQPDFEDAERQRVLALLRGGAFLSAVLPRLSERPEVQVFIGDESLPDELRRCGVVVATYGVDGAVTGLLGVLGPTRMSYWRTISSVQYMARLMSEFVSDLYAESA
jgi:heat-inducible transcriptional repressor